MILYVETNFVLEIALSQEESEEAEQLLTLAESHRFRLAYPAFSLVEPNWELGARSATRRQIATSLDLEADRLERSRRNLLLVGTIRPVVESIRALQHDELGRLESTLARMLNAGECIALDAIVALRSSTFRARRVLDPPDATVLASIMTHVEQQDRAEPKCFVSRDRRAFLDRLIVEELRQYNCRVVAHFADALRIVERFAT